MLREASRPGYVTVALDYYDDKEQAAFESGSYPKRVADLAGQEIEIPISEFLTYYLFDDKEHSKVPPTIEDLRWRISEADEELSHWVEWSGTSLRVKDEFQSLKTSVTKQLGDAVSMSIANRIHGLTEADWNYIERANVKTMDWHLASDGRQHIEIESKGAFVDDASRLTGLSDHRASIREKKAEALTPGYHRAPALRYGTILAIDQHPSSIMHCRLVDPDGSNVDADPKATQLMHRLRWARNLVAMISRRSSLVVALNNRLAALERMPVPWALEHLPLVKGSREPIEMESDFPGAYSKFFANRTVISGQLVGGQIVRYFDDYVLFVGIQQDWLTALAAQDFGRILEMKFEPSTNADALLHCAMSTRQFQSQGLGERISNVSFSDRAELVEFDLPAVIQQSPAGMAFGLGWLC